MAALVTAGKALVPYQHYQQSASTFEQGFHIWFHIC